MVASLCVSVCALQAEPLNLRTQNLQHTLWTIISQSSLKVKVVGVGYPKTANFQHFHKTHLFYDF